jgi:hypothetical protein
MSLRRMTIVFLATTIFVPEAFAQTATATGTGTGIATSKSQSTAVAISGQGGTGVGTASQTVNLNQSTPAVTSATVNNTGTQTIKNVPTVFAPGLAAAGLETCLGSVSAGAGVVGTGATFGTTIPDGDCAARLDARTLWSFGLKKAAIARLCQREGNYNAMPEVCAQYLPVRYAQPVAAAQPAWYNTFAAKSPAPEPAPYRGGPIMLVEGSTGKDRLCNNYDEAHQRCRVWAYAVTHHSSSSKMVMSTKPAKAATPALAPTPNNAEALPAVITEGKSK